MRRKHAGTLMLVVGGLAIIILAIWPRVASADCGSSASSCKDCHEVKKQDPVNTKGVWHTNHSFGDFCEFCHSGNVKGKDKAAAHVGLTSPLADVKASCQSCHPSNYMERAQSYATVLGKPIGSGGTTTSGGTPVASAAATRDTGCGPAAPTGGQTIDLNTVFADTKSPPPTGRGNLVLIAMIAATGTLLVGLVWHYDRPLERGIAAYRRLVATPAFAGATTDGGTISSSAAIAGRPDLASLLLRLKSSDPATIRALEHLLADPENGPKVIKALSNLDFRSLAALGGSNQKVLAALVALAKEMKA